MERICIIGGSGTGKTALANNLGKEFHRIIGANGFFTGHDVETKK